MPYPLPVRTQLPAFGRATGRLGWLRGATGAGIAIGVAGLITWILLDGSPAMPWLVAPIGASAVLVFALPASPLAQPWPVVGGNLISITIGLTCAQLIPVPILAAAAAVAGALAAMSLARCLHPPGGACALLGALGGPAIMTHGWLGLALPLGLNLVALLAVAWAYNNATGHSWPHTSPPPLPPRWAGSYAKADLDAVLEDWEEVLDVSREDLDALFQAVERRAEQRWREGLPR